MATVPVGYADGVNRRLGYGNASFIVNGAECPTLGSICMDLCMIDVSAAHGVKVGDSVEIFGTAQPVERLAETFRHYPIRTSYVGVAKGAARICEEVELIVCAERY